jgi:hypothetical protein
MRTAPKQPSLAKKWPTAESKWGADRLVRQVLVRMRHGDAAPVRPRIAKTHSIRANFSVFSAAKLLSCCDCEKVRSSNRPIFLLDRFATLPGLTLRALFRALPSGRSWACWLVASLDVFRLLGIGGGLGDGRDGPQDYPRFHFSGTFNMFDHKRFRILATLVALLVGLPAATAGILDLDFTSDGSGAASAFGGGAPYGTAPGFTPFVVAELGPSAQTTSNPSITANGVTFTINGSVSAWPGNNGAVNPDVLRGDYLFFGNADGALGVTPYPMPWTVTGLTANKDYVFTFTHGENGGSSRSLLIASGTTNMTINGVVGTHVGNMTLKSDGTGMITGTFAGMGGEGDLAAMSLNLFQTQGDANGDGLVNAADFTIISDHLFTSQSSGTLGDLDLDGFVDFADFRIWKNAAGSVGANLSIPEPAALAVAIPALFALGWGRRRRVS